MSVGRNWTRRSIEELVAAYMRGKAGKGIVPTMLTNIIPMVLGNADPDSFGRIPVGALSNTLEDNWYRPLSDVSQAYPNYLSPWWFYGSTENSSQYCRYESISGTLGIDISTSATGELRRKTDNGLSKKKFAVMIFPKNCSFEFLKKIVVTSNGFDVTSGTSKFWGFVTCDPINERNAFTVADSEVNRVIYIPMSNNRIADSSTVPCPVVLSRESELTITPFASNSHLNVNAGYTNNDLRVLSLYPYYITKYPGCRSLVTYNSGMSGNDKTRSDTFVNAVKSAYSGTIVRNGDERAMNFLAIICVESSRDDFKNDIFTVSRLVLDNCYALALGVNPENVIDTPTYYADDISVYTEGTVRMKKALADQTLHSSDVAEVSYRFVQI